MSLILLLELPIVSSLHCLNAVLLLECSVALLRMFLQSVKFTSDLWWLDCDLWTISAALSTSIAVELKIEICDSLSVMQS